MIKALFFDIDGTLVSFKTHQIPQSTIEAIEAAKAKGLKIFIATGRPAVIINNLQELQQRNLIDGYITMNGAYCFVGNKVIYKSSIPEADVKKMAELSVRNNFSCIFVSERSLCVCQPSDMVKEIFNVFLKVDVIPERTPEEVVKEEIFQMTPFITLQQEQEIMPLIPGSEAGRWFPSFADITAKGNTKQKGVDEMIAHFGIELKETMAFGDGGNDISMLRHVEIGVAMGNAENDVKAHANYVTTNVDQDGIANALKHFNII